MRKGLRHFLGLASASVAAMGKKVEETTEEVEAFSEAVEPLAEVVKEPHKPRKSRANPPVPKLNRLPRGQRTSARKHSNP